jgi:hypothetical protein
VIYVEIRMSPFHAFLLRSLPILWSTS